MEPLETSISPRHGVLLLISLFGAFETHSSSTLLHAQSPAPVKPESQDSARVIRWTDALWVVGGVVIISLVDEPVQRYTQKHRSNTLESFAAVFREQGSVFYYGGIVGVLAVGLIKGDDDVLCAAGRLVGTVVASTIAMQGVKMLLGRSRPNANAGAFDFNPFSTEQDSLGVEQRESMPSGHTTAAFAIATALADEIGRMPVSVLLYLWASGAGFSRVYENRHWVSDTVVGALLGITTAKVLTGRWRVFNLKPPRFLLAESGTPSLAWTIDF